ncbi:unnamed protein product [Rhizopus stolonifer]
MGHSRKFLKKHNCKFQIERLFVGPSPFSYFFFLKNLGLMEKRSSNQRTIVGNHYEIGKKLGEGSFGIIYQGLNLLTRQSVAIKFEFRKSEIPQLKHEFKTYQALTGILGVPNVYYFGREGLHNVLVIDLLGPSLEDLFEVCSHQLSITTVALVAKQMIDRVQSLHEHHMIYRDIKPENFLMGRPGTVYADQVFMIDYEHRSLSGTARYMSTHTHLRREQSRRDDLEALGYVFMYFLRGSLPWQGVKATNNKEKYEKIGACKQVTTTKELCGEFPEEFAIYVEYVRMLNFEETPDYDFLRGLFDRVLERQGSSVYDWLLLDNGKGWEARFKQLKEAHIKKSNHRPPKHRIIDTRPVVHADVKKEFWNSFILFFSCHRAE